MRTLRIHLPFAFILIVLLSVAACAQTYKVLYDFGSQTGDPRNPTDPGIIAEGHDGELYTSSLGGIIDLTTGCLGGGEVFKMSASGLLTEVNCSLGDHGSASGLTLGPDGFFYGTANGDTNADGSIFKVTPGGILTTLYNLNGKTDGSVTPGPPVRGSDGAYYGVAVRHGNDGSVCGSTGCGTVWRIASSGNTGGNFSVIHTFDNADGSGPFAPLLLGNDGNLYGSTTGGNGSLPCLGGTIFKITQTFGFQTLVKFANCLEGANPMGPLIQGFDGNFYGTTVHGGADLFGGTVFKMTPAGVLSTLHSFTENGEGVQPFGGVVQALDGNFYGTTKWTTNLSGCGTIYQLTPAGAFTPLFTFPSNGSMGCNPETTLVQHTNGRLYGTTNSGGTHKQGVFFSFGFGTLTAFVKTVVSYGKVGSTVEILGQGFTSTTRIGFSGIPSGSFSPPITVSPNYLTVAVPNGAMTGFISIINVGGTLKSNQKFRVVPQITTFSPSSGLVGTSVVITGISLKQTTKVTFGGAAASFTINSDSKVTAIVPTGAVTGPISITTAGGNARSASNFTVL